MGSNMFADTFEAVGYTSRAFADAGVYVAPMSIFSGTSGNGVIFVTTPYGVARSKHGVAMLIQKAKESEDGA